MCSENNVGPGTEGDFFCSVLFRSEGLSLRDGKKFSGGVWLRFNQFVVKVHEKKPALFFVYFDFSLRVCVCRYGVLLSYLS